MKYSKIIGVLSLGIITIFALTILYKPESVYARGSSRGSSNSSSSSRPSAIPGQGARKSDNGWAQASLDGNCKNIGGHCVVFSTHSCGNFYINGYHYGGSHACSILGIDCGNKSHGGGGNNSGGVSFNGTNRNINRNATRTTQTTQTTLTRDCTPGIDCPDADLGPIMTGVQVNPSYANSNTNSCPLFWVPGKESDKAKITCKLITGSKSVDVPKDQNIDFPTGYPVPIGNHTFQCTRTYTKSVQDIGSDGSVIGSHDETATTSIEQQINCRSTPKVIEI